MKILKVKIARNQNSNGTSYIYPQEYDASKIQVLCYETTNMDNYDSVVARGNDYEYCVGVVEDEDVGNFLVSDDIEEMDYNTSLSTCESWVKQVNKITDQDKIISILDKINNSEELTQDEKDSINPSNSSTGVNLTKSFQDILDESLVLETEIIKKSVK